MSLETDDFQQDCAPKPTASRRFRLLYVLWALPVSMFSIPLLPLALYRGRWQLRNGALEVSAPALAWFLSGPWFRALTGGTGFAAATIGHVIVARDAYALDACRIHEHVHVRQCERWGALFPLAYIGAGLYAAWAARSFDAYYQQNPFEIEARSVEHAHPASDDANL